MIAFMIEESNVSLLELSDNFARIFGKTTDFWTSKITSWSTLLTFFTGNLVIWNVNNFMRNFVNYSENPIERDLIYQWRLKTQAYLNSLNLLTKKIKNMKKCDIPYFIDETYFRYHR